MYNIYLIYRKGIIGMDAGLKEQLRIRKEQIRIKQDAIKDQIIINNLKNLRFCRMADEDTASQELISHAESILESINSYDAKPEKVIIKENGLHSRHGLYCIFIKEL